MRLTKQHAMNNLSKYFLAKQTIAKLIERNLLNSYFLRTLDLCLCAEGFYYLSKFRPTITLYKTFHAILMKKFYCILTQWRPYDLRGELVLGSDWIIWTIVSVSVRCNRDS